MSHLPQWAELSFITHSIVFSTIIISSVFAEALVRAYTYVWASYTSSSSYIQNMCTSTRACLHNRCLWAAPVIRRRRDRWDRRALKNDSEGRKRMCGVEVSRGRRWVEGRRDEGGRKTIWEGKYLPIHLPKEAVLPICAAVCVCVLWNDNVWHSGAAAARETDSEGRDREGDTAMRRGMKTGKGWAVGRFCRQMQKVWKAAVWRKTQFLHETTLTCNLTALP